MYENLLKVQTDPRVLHGPLGYTIHIESAMRHTWSITAVPEGRERSKVRVVDIVGPSNILLSAAVSVQHRNPYLLPAAHKPVLKRTSNYIHVPVGYTELSACIA